MTREPLRVVLTGSECTGKTTLALTLAERFRAPSSPEFVRGFVAGLGRPLALADVPLVGVMQARGEDSAVRGATNVVFHDTDVWSTVVYSRHYFGRCPDSVEELAKGRRGHLYLLHHPDVPWRDEAGQREGGGERQIIHAAFVSMLKTLEVPVVDVSGSWADREAVAVRAVDDWMSEREAAR